MITQVAKTLEQAIRQALRNLYDRSDISVVIDHLQSEFSAAYRIIGVEKAAADSECQKAMSLAAIEKCLHLQNIDSSTLSK